MIPAPFDPKAVKLLAAYETSTTLFAAYLDEARQTLYGAGMDGSLYVVNLGAEKPAAEKKGTLHENYVSTLALRDGQFISGGFDRKLVWTDRETGERVRSIVAHDGWVRKLVVTPDGKQLISVGDDMLVKVWDAADGKPVASLTGHAKKTPEGYLSALYTVAVSPDGKFIASADRAGFVRVWDLQAGKSVAEFRAIELYTFDAQKRARAIGGPRGLAFSANGERLAVSGIGVVTNVDGFVGPCRIELWDWKAGKQIAAGQDKHNAIINHVAFSANGSWLIGAGGGDNGAALVRWDLAGTTPFVAKPKGHLHAFTVDAAESRMYAAGHGGFQVWQLRNSDIPLGED